jgi:hypothetical protein
VKLLLDQNLSHRILDSIRADYPDSAHLREHALQ